MAESAIDNNSEGTHYVDVGVMEGFHDDLTEGSVTGIPESEVLSPEEQRKKGITRAKVILALFFLILILTTVYFIDKGLSTIRDMRNSAIDNGGGAISRNAEPVPSQNQRVVSNFNIIPINQNPAVVQPGQNSGVNTSCVPSLTYPCLQ